MQGHYQKRKALGSTERDYSSYVLMRCCSLGMNQMLMMQVHYQKRRALGSTERDYSCPFHPSWRASPSHPRLTLQVPVPVLMSMSISMKILMSIYGPVEKALVPPQKDHGLQTEQQQVHNLLILHLHHYQKHHHHHNPPPSPPSQQWVQTNTDPHGKKNKAKNPLIQRAEFRLVQDHYQNPTNPP